MDIRRKWWELLDHEKERLWKYRKIIFYFEKSNKNKYRSKRTEAFVQKLSNISSCLFKMFHNFKKQLALIKIVAFLGPPHFTSLPAPPLMNSPSSRWFRNYLLLFSFFGWFLCSNVAKGAAWDHCYCYSFWG